MDDTMLSISYESLGKILDQLQEAPEIKNSRELAEWVRNAISFHQQMAGNVQALRQEQRRLRQELSDLTREPGERVCDQVLQNQFGKYEEMRHLGATPQEIYLATKDDGFDHIESIAALRRVFQFSLQEAQDAISQVARQCAA